MLDRIQGAMFGVAIGDALGGTTEFMTQEEIRAKYGKLTEIIGGGCWRLAPGETTDDTAMTLAVARGILESPGDPMGAIGEHFLKWYGSNPKDVGIIVCTALDRYEGDWFEAAIRAHEEMDEMSAGNGSLMRCLPVALAYADPVRMERETRRQSKMTHFDELAAEACVIYNRIAWRMLNGEKLHDAIRVEIEGTRYASMLHETPDDVPPTGFVVNTFRWVLYHLLRAESFEDVVVSAANGGYDSDTVGAIAGGLAGLHCGYAAIPEKYTGVLLEREELIRISAELYRVRNTR